MKVISTQQGQLSINEFYFDLLKQRYHHSAILELRASGFRLLLIYKDIKQLSLDFMSKQDLDLFMELFQSVSTLNQLFCFDSPGSQISVKHQAPWMIYSIEKDIERMKANLGNWRICTLNSSYNFCPTYPLKFLVPKSISDNTIRHCAKFRSKERIPVLSYVWKNNCTITRCAQPMVGLKGTRSVQDEKLIEAIFNASSSNVGSWDPNATNSAGDLSAKGFVSNEKLGSEVKNIIIDARPIANALAQTAMGAGTESLENYKASQILFLGIENIHAVRDSFVKLVEVCINPDGIDKTLLPKTLWLNHMKPILKGTLLVVETIKNNGNVLVHCSDGWDRTTQLTSLAQICLDPYFRTIEGLIYLIEKEWVSFGHKFRDRLGYLHKEKSPEKDLPINKLFGKARGFFNQTFMEKVQDVKLEKHQPVEISPIFLQFLDCLYQIWRQYPTRFEYDERLLEFLYISSCRCDFGIFAFNSEFERRSFRDSGSILTGEISDVVHRISKSLWQYVSEHHQEFVNDLYQESDEVLLPSHKNLGYWSKVYFRGTSTVVDEVIDKPAEPFQEDPWLDPNYKTPTAIETEEILNHITNDLLQPVVEVTGTSKDLSIDDSFRGNTTFTTIDVDDRVEMTDFDNHIPNPLMNPWQS